MREIRSFEQGRLGARVGVHARVIVEVIPAEVGEHRGVDMDRLDPTLLESVRRDLHDEHVDPRIPQFRESAMNLDRTRGGEGHGFQHPRRAGAQSAHHRASISAASCREMRDARLPVRSGHCGNRHVLGRIAVIARRGVSDRARDIGDSDDHRPGVEPHRRRSALDYHRRGARCDCAACEPARIHSQTPTREEQRSGGDRTTVVAHGRHHPVESGGDRRVSLQEPPQAPTSRCFARRHDHGVLSDVRFGGAAATLIAGLRIISGSSGAIPSTRSEPSTMSENTGAATAPP